MGKHAPGDRILQLEGIDDILERLLNGDVALDLAVHGVGPDHDIARCIGKRVEDLPDHVLGIVRGGIGLDAGAHVAFCPHLGAGQHVEDLLIQGD